MTDILKFPPKPPALVGIKSPVVNLRPNNKLTEPDPVPHWTSALDCLRELINDIEHGRINPPDVIYVAMQTRHPTVADMVAYPSYCWAEHKSSALLMGGLLAKHQAKVS